VSGNYSQTTIDFDCNIAWFPDGELIAPMVAAPLKLASRTRVTHVGCLFPLGFEVGIVPIYQEVAVA